MSDQLNKSPLKWAGGKSKLIPLLRQILPDGKRLIEPFVGGGSVFINMAYPEYVLADANRDLIEFYGVLSSAGDRGIWGLLDMFVPHLNTQENFLRLRSEFNQKSGADPFRLAALFLYLNRHCFNGLCRYNSKGEFNVSFGKYDQPYAPVKELFHMRNCLRIGNATIRCASYEDTLQLVDAGDVVYCLARGTMIRMEDESFTAIESLRTGDIVFGGKVIKATMKRHHAGEVLNITPQSLPENIVLTGDHRVVRISGKNGKQETRSDEMLWLAREVVPARDLKKGDYLLVPTGGLEKDVKWNFSNPALVTCPRKILSFNPGPELFRLLGYYAAEGHTGKDRGSLPCSVIFSFGNQKKQRQIDDCMNCVENVFGIDAALYRNCPHPTVDQVCLHSKTVAEFFDRFVAGTAADKSLHPELMTAPINLQKELLIGWLRCDGGVSLGSRNRFKLTGTSSSPILARQMFQIALRCALRPSYKVRYNQRDGKPIAAHDVFFGSEDAAKLGWEVPAKKFRSARKIINEHILIRILDITPRHYDDLVYDIDVDGDDLFGAPYALTHNCDPPYVPISATANFTGYTGDGFSLEDQQALASEAERLRRIGATVVISNADTEFTRHIYQYADHIAEVSVQRNISCDGSNRGKAKELIAVYGKSCL